MRRTAISILGIAVDVDAPEPVAAELLAELDRRTHLVAHLAADTATLLYELRPQTTTSYEVVRIEGPACERIDIADSISSAASLIADNVHPWIADQHGELLLIHSGAVEWKGVGVVLPGRSHSGKSSLVAALLRAGASYLSDEFAPLDRDGNVHPYPRHLSMRDADHTTTLVPPAAFGALVASGPVPLRFIVVTAYKSAASFAPERLSGAAALLSLIDNTLAARSRPVHTMEIVARLAANVEVLRSDRGDSDETAVKILELIDAKLGTD